MLILGKKFKRHLEAFASEFFIYIYIYIYITYSMASFTLLNVQHKICKMYVFTSEKMNRTQKKLIKVFNFGT